MTFPTDPERERVPNGGTRTGEDQDREERQLPAADQRTGGNQDDSARDYQPDDEESLSKADKEDQRVGRSGMLGDQTNEIWVICVQTRLGRPAGATSPKKMPPDTVGGH